MHNYAGGKMSEPNPLDWIIIMIWMSVLVSAWEYIKA